MMKIINKDNQSGQESDLINDSETTARIMKLIEEYQNENNAYYQAADNAYQLKQRKLQIERTIKHEFTINKLREFEVTSGQKGAVKVLPTKPRLVIDIKEAVPADYVSLRMQRLFDMDRIEQDLKNGKQIPGVHLESIETLDIDIRGQCCPG